MLSFSKYFAILDLYDLFDLFDISFTIYTDW